MERSVNCTIKAVEPLEALREEVGGTKLLLLSGGAELSRRKPSLLTHTSGDIAARFFILFFCRMPTVLCPNIKFYIHNQKRSKIRNTIEANDTIGHITLYYHFLHQLYFLVKNKCINWASILSMINVFFFFIIYEKCDMFILYYVTMYYVK